MENSFLSDATVAFIQDKIKQQQQEQQHGAADSSAVTGTSSLTEPSTITASMTSSSSSSSSLRKISKQNDSFQSGPLSLHLENQTLETENTKLFDIVLECVRALEEKPLRATNCEISQNPEKKIQIANRSKTKHSSMTAVKKPTQNNIEHLVHQISLQTKKRDQVQMSPNTDKKQEQESEVDHGSHSMEIQLIKTQHELRDALDLIQEKEKKIIQMQFEMDRLSSDLNWSESRRKELNMLLEMSHADTEDCHDKINQGVENNSDESDEDDDDGDVSFSTPLASALRKMPNLTPSTKDNNIHDSSGRNIGQCTSSHILNNRNKLSTMDVPQKRTTTAPTAPQRRNNNNIFPQQRYQPTQQGTLYHVPQTSMYQNPFTAPQNPALNSNRNMLGLVVTAEKNDGQDTVISDLHSHAGASKYQEGNDSAAVQTSSSFEKEIAAFYNGA